MTGLDIRTGRLLLRAATPGLLEADIRGREELALFLGARVPPGWPPPLMDGDVRGDFLRMAESPDGPLFLTWYWIRTGKGGAGDILVGSGGVVQSGDEPETVFLGYSVLDDYQNRGYATEAVAALIPVLFRLHGIRQIMASTYPQMAPSIRVLEKCGFTRLDNVRSGSGAEEGTVVYAISHNTQNVNAGP